VSNKISKIENLDCCPKLNMLELGDNKIRKVENLENLTHLTELYLGKNKITKMEGMETLSDLKILSIQVLFLVSFLWRTVELI